MAAMLASMSIQERTLCRKGRSDGLPQGRANTHGDLLSATPKQWRVFAFGRAGRKEYSTIEIAAAK